MTCTEDGFDAWGKDMGGYSANPQVAAAVEEKYHHSEAGGDQYPAKNDRGYDWWTAEESGELVLEDPQYCAEVSYTVGSWIDVLDRYSGN